MVPGTATGDSAGNTVTLAAMDEASRARLRALIGTWTGNAAPALTYQWWRADDFTNLNRRCVEITGDDENGALMVLEYVAADHHRVAGAQLLGLFDELDRLVTGKLLSNLVTSDAMIVMSAIAFLTLMPWSACM